ncbi:ArsB/NhaD family transporter [Phycicoccus flavus]|uniref:SLC13 family permease n=1 Tax=Phycicoccus flavus TaxID=2502783 RepID=UPI00197CADE0|nr:ArsB/NhaD family transporter [Phycicoccus flavus]
MAAVVAVGIFVVAYVLIASEKVNRTAVALAGAAGMVLIGAVRGRDVFFSEDTGIDWNVIFLLLGMMIIVGILRRTGVFEFVAIWAAQRARARPFRMMTLLVVITAGASALLDNVTTVLLVAPVTLLLCERLALAPVPFLLAEAMASNIGGTATLIGDPPNIIIGSRAGLTFDDFLVHLAPVVVVLVAVFVGLAWVLWGRHLRYDPERAESVMALTPRETITDPTLLRRMLVILGLVLVGFLTHNWTHLDPSLVALLGAGAAVLASRMPSEEYLAEVEWETLLFFAGLFVMVGALVHDGVITVLARELTGAIGEDYLLAAQGILLGSGILSGIVDNIPYVATMAPLVHDLVGPGNGLPPERQSLWWALALGADLGGNATAIGASANVVITGIARRNEHPISFWTFTRYGLVVTAVTIGLCVPYVWLRYFGVG